MHTKWSQIFNTPLAWFNLKLVRLSSLQQLQSAKNTSITDIESDAEFMALYNKVESYTMVGIERSYALYKAVDYLLSNKVAGDFVECGVWKGGSCMLIAYILMMRNETNRHIYLYDTYEGMAKPGEHDGEYEKEEWKRLQVNAEKSDWCYSTLEEVKANMRLTGYPPENIRYVKGKVEDTIPGISPKEIALLRLDTDWYESTKHELEHLFPLLSNNGILLIDDYGVWQGARKATDEYFASANYFFHRVDHSGVLMIKQ